MTTLDGTPESTALSNSAHPNPALSNPVLPNPALSNPVLPNPALPMPAPPDPALLNPVLPNPARADSAPAEPVRVNPLPADPVHADLVYADPVRPDPERAGPARPGARHASATKQQGEARSRHGPVRRDSFWPRLAPRLLVGVRLISRSRGARGQPRRPGRHAAGSIPPHESRPSRASSSAVSRGEATIR